MAFTVNWPIFSWAPAGLHRWHSPWTDLFSAGLHRWHSLWTDLFSAGLHRWHSPWTDLFSAGLHRWHSPWTDLFSAGLHRWHSLWTDLFSAGLHRFCLSITSSQAETIIFIAVGCLLRLKFELNRFDHVTVFNVLSEKTRAIIGIFPRNTKAKTLWQRIKRALPFNLSPSIQYATVPTKIQKIQR